MRLSLRKSKINNILFTKRNIDLNNELNEEFKKEYKINDCDFSIPENMKMNISKLSQNVSSNIYLFLLF